jgi:hypothetical protein
MRLPRASARHGVIRWKRRKSPLLFCDAANDVIGTSLRSQHCNILVVIGAKRALMDFGARRLGQK